MLFIFGYNKNIKAALGEKENEIIKNSNFKLKSSKIQNI